MVRRPVRQLGEVIVIVIALSVRVDFPSRQAR